ncbi:MAG: zinc ribbon domain-containing protein [Desulfobacca sp.]|nr:zinc ribbon domain-containing protein [Desulfobacca sp.]
MNEAAEKFEVTILHDLWQGLGCLVPGPKSIISPIRDDAAPPFSADQLQALRQAGLTDDSGSLVTRSRRALGFLAQAQKFARLNVQLGGRAIDKTFFYHPEALHAVSLTLANQGVILTDPASATETVAELEQFIGGSSFYNLNFEIELNLPEALVLTAVMDLHRRALLRSYFDESLISAPACDLASLEPAVNQGTVNLMWLVSVLRHIADYRDPLSEADISSVLSALVEVGHLTKKDHAYSLTEAISNVAGRYIVLDKAVLFETGGDLGAGKLGLARCACLQAGVNDLLFIEIPDKVRLVTVSAAVLKAIIVQALTNLQFPEVSASPEAVIKSAAVSPTSDLTCPHCQAPVHPDSKFCDTCGASLAALPPKAEPVDAATLICAQCQMPLKVGAKFCRNCGAAVAPVQPESTLAQPISCPKCGRALKPGAKFCSGCGQKI